MRLLVLLTLAAVPAIAHAQRPQVSPLPSAPSERCSAASGTEPATVWLDRAAERVLPKTPPGHVLRYRMLQDIPFSNLSERVYAPFTPDPNTSNFWIDPTTGVEGRAPLDRTLRRDQYPASVEAPDESYLARDTALVPATILRSNGAVYRRMNPWLVLFDWRRHAAEVRVTSRCVFREYSRIVLERAGERLYLTESDGVPIKLERTEPDGVWGQFRAEYLWTKWWGVRGGGLFPTASFRLADGAIATTRRVLDDRMEMIPRDSSPRLDIPAVVQAGSGALPGVTLLVAGAADTVRVNDHTFLLASRASTETVALLRDTVFLLDVTFNEARARGDSTWIARLFPGRHPVVVVVTDVSGSISGALRFWVARGATIVSHASSEDFLRRVIDRKWTLNPDALEKARSTARLRFRAVTDSLRLAGGALVVHALRNRSTEGGLAVWMPSDRFLWAGGYIENDPLSPRGFDLVQTMRALGIRPDTTAALHLKLTPWPEIERRSP